MEPFVHLGSSGAVLDHRLTALDGEDFKERHRIVDPSTKEFLIAGKIEMGDLFKMSCLCQVSGRVVLSLTSHG
jgi:hypothetical protein